MLRPGKIGSAPEKYDFDQQTMGYAFASVVRDGGFTPI